MGVYSFLLAVGTTFWITVDCMRRCSTVGSIFEQMLLEMIRSLLCRFYQRRCRKIDRVSEIDWAQWEPIKKATLLFVTHNEQMLLIRKKRDWVLGRSCCRGA